MNVSFVKTFFIYYLILISIALGDENKFNRIEILVNENVITKYDILQRMKINSILGNVELNNDNYNELMSAVVDDLVVEQLKNKKVNEYNINLDKEEFNQYEKRFYSSIGYEKKELKELFSINDINYKYLFNFIEIEAKWQKLIYGLYLRVTSVTEQEISDLINKNPDLNKEIAKEIILQKQLDIKSKKLIKDLRDEATIEFK